MSRLLLVLVALGATLGLCYLLSAGGDVQTFIPPPESVAEQFLRAVHTHRYEAALSYLAANTGVRIKDEDIKRFDQQLRQRLGDYEVSGGFTKFLEGSQAIANVRTKGGAQDETWPVFLLSLEHGLWKIEKIEKLH